MATCSPPPAQGSRGRSVRRAVLGLAAAVVLACMGGILLTPGPVDRPVYGKVLRAIRRLQEYGLPGWVDYAAAEAAANVLLFVPLGLLAALLLPPRRWWLALLLCLGTAAGAEVFQELFLPLRQGNLQDVLNNGVGALLGVAVAATGRGLRAGTRRGRTR
ncbi:VanZ family protein [Arthrobacter zhaoxinii]|uniref:VanZ family protein n=1 Tax=Arthrobacter zhaoxinii TaxID=2964616 RepID=A0ABY5YWF3_9MICC|nr:VanZ family protein [Arthrobacter zhaoxinii]UWX97980.1 VanZ family protein [Arthrobacter zhaoxinii]